LREGIKTTPAQSMALAHRPPRQSVVDYGKAHLPQPDVGSTRGEPLMPTCWIVAGPNGAGKTTFALEYLPQVANGLRFVNADLIAAGLSPLAPDREFLTASRLYLNEIETCVRKRDDFAFETTLAGRSYLKLINLMRAELWHVELIYLALPSVEMSKLRVTERVLHGGHNIPTADIERRFPRSLANLLELFSYQVNACRCFMNCGPRPELVFEQRGEVRNVIHPKYYQHLLSQARS
jgi:predicted ABC-type ATPase